MDDHEAQRPIPWWLGALFLVYGVGVLVGLAVLGYALSA